MLHSPVAMSAATMTTTGPRFVAHQRIIRSIMFLNQKAEGRSEKQKAESRKQKAEMLRFTFVAITSAVRLDGNDDFTFRSFISAFCFLPSAFNSLSSPFVDER